MKFFKKLSMFVIIMFFMLSNMPVYAMGAPVNTVPIEDQEGITAREGANLIDDYTGGKML